MTPKDEVSHDSYRDREALLRPPHVLCPNCARHLQGRDLDCAEEQYPLPTGVDYASGAPLIGQAGRMVYRLAVCGCRVSQEWAAAFTAELNRRRCGLPPAQVEDMTDEKREAQKKKLLGQLTSLFSLRDLAGDQATRAQYEYQLVMATDQLLRLYPGEHNKPLKVELPLSKEVKAWADKNGLLTPAPTVVAPPPADPGFGYPAGYPMPKKPPSKTVQGSARAKGLSALMFVRDHRQQAAQLVMQAVELGCSPAHAMTLLLDIEHSLLRFHEYGVALPTPAALFVTALFGAAPLPFPKVVWTDLAPPPPALVVPAPTPAPEEPAAAAARERQDREAFHARFGRGRRRVRTDLPGEDVGK